jgi:hypothetical protein
VGGPELAFGFAVVVCLSLSFGQEVGFGNALPFAHAGAMIVAIFFASLFSPLAILAGLSIVAAERLC